MLFGGIYSSASATALNSLNVTGASRKRISDYAGVHAGALDRIQEEYGFVMPKPMNPQEKRKASSLGTILGGLSKK